MSKDHIPSDFGRPSGYKSDLEVAETGQMVKSINTSFGSKNHNAYIIRKDSTHEHFYYNPKEQKSGWHGHLYETRNNKIPQNVKPNGDNNMQKSNSFLENIKVDKATRNRCDDAGRKAARNMNNNQSVKNSHKEGGMERGDAGPASHGREGGAYKSGEAQSHNGAKSGQSASNSGHGTANGGHGDSNGGHGASGGGHGGAGGGHGGSGGGHGSAGGGH